MPQVLGFRELGLADYEPTWLAMQRFTDERKLKPDKKICAISMPNSSLHIFPVRCFLISMPSPITPAHYLTRCRQLKNSLLTCKRWESIRKNIW